MAFPLREVSGSSTIAALKKFETGSGGKFRVAADFCCSLYLSQIGFIVKCTRLIRCYAVKQARKIGLIQRHAEFSVVK